jgi:hypothetical protein
MVGTIGNTAFRGNPVCQVPKWNGRFGGRSHFVRLMPKRTILGKGLAILN